MLESLDALEAEGLVALTAASDAQALESWRIEYLGGKGRMKNAAAGLKDVSKEEKPAAGKRLNEVKQSLEGAFKTRQAEQGARRVEQIDEQEDEEHDERGGGQHSDGVPSNDAIDAPADADRVDGLAH